MKQKRDREEACHICGHYHDVCSPLRRRAAALSGPRFDRDAAWAPGPRAQFEGGEVCGVCGHVIVMEPADKHENVIPTTIIPGFLYLGNYDSASRSELLKAMNVSHILNVGRARALRSDRPPPCAPADARAPRRPQSVPSCQALYRNTFTYHNLTTSPPDFNECFQFLSACRLQLGEPPPRAACRQAGS
jgi:dual specificity MAP kinase phosphatase